jgi:8-oxo-dGTP pyrophosphatase MutT (NUDIX family)
MQQQYIYSENPLEDFNPVFEVSSCFVEFDGEILLLLRQDHKPQPNTYGMPAWKIDEWELPIEAIIRELQEETSIILKEDNLEFITKLYVKYPAYHYIYHVYRSIFDVQPEVIINPIEHKEFLWISPEDVMNIDHIPGLDVCIKKAYL